MLRVTRARSTGRREAESLKQRQEILQAAKSNRAAETHDQRYEMRQTNRARSVASRVVKNHEETDERL